MNERIKLLAEQAWTMVSDEERARNELYEADTQRERRDQVFAELLIREYSYDVMNLHGAKPERVQYAAKCWGVEV